MAEYFRQENRFTLFPLQDLKVWEFYNKAITSFWRPEELDFGNDNFNSLTEDEKFFISHILAFFAGSDGIVNENLAERFYTEIQNAEIRMFYGFQIAMENIHSHTYSLLIDRYIRNEEEKLKLFNAVNEYPAIKKKADWCLKHINDEEPFEYRLMCFAICEGIFFSGAFCAIYWLKKRGNKLKALSFSNELISRDEALHTEFAVYLYNKLGRHLTDNQMYYLIDEAVEIEKEFICEALPCRLIGMNSDLMSQYIEFVADRLLMMCNHKIMYGTQNPFDFMETISLEGKTNFFESRVSEYALADKSGKEEAFSEMDF